MKQRLRPCFRLIGFLLAAGLAACGESDNDNTALTDGQVVRYGAISSKIRGLDPMDIGDTTSSGLGSNIYECLYQYHYLKRPYELIPALAAELPQVSSDGLTYTILIRNDVFFQDNPCFQASNGQGRKVVAQDVVYSWMRLADIKNLSKNWWIFDSRIQGLDEFRQYAQSVSSKKDVDYDRPIEGLKAIDDVTLQIKLTKPWPQILYLLAHLPTAVVAREAVEHYGDEFLNHPVGTGPYRLEKWRRGSKIILTRNPTFRNEQYPSEGEPEDEANGLLTDAGKSLPLIDRAEYTIIEEDQPYWLTFLSGDTDSAGIPKDNFSQAIATNHELSPDMKRRGIILSKFQDPATFWYGFNMEDPLVGQNLPLRQAMNAAFDRDRYIELFLNGRGATAHGVLPPMFADFNPELNSPYTKFDLTRANELVEDARRQHGGPLPKIVLTVGGTDTTARQMGQFLKRSYEKIGLNFDVEYMDWPSAQDKVKTKSAQMYAMGWVADYPDAESFMLLFYGPNASPGANNMNYKNKTFDHLYEKVVAATPSTQRTHWIQQMEQMVIDELPCVLTVHRTNYVLRYPWVKNSKPHVFGGGYLKYQNIDMAMRHAKVGH